MLKYLNHVLEVVKEKATQCIGEAANDAPFEVVKMFHSHIAFTFQPVPPAAQTAIAVHEKLKVHIQ